MADDEPDNGTNCPGSRAGAVSIYHPRCTKRIERGIGRREIEEAVAGGEIIEDYPAHHYGPACLVSGRTSAGKPLHILFALEPVLAIVTLYEPDPDEWEEDLKTRRRKQQ